LCTLSEDGEDREVRAMILIDREEDDDDTAIDNCDRCGLPESECECDDWIED
jgi:hypothetical protein